MKLITLGLTLISSLVLVGCGSTSPIPTPATNSNPAINTQPTSTTADPTSQTYTLTEIAQHAAPTDCWFAVDGIVYDVTQFIASGQHLGGAEILKGCGKDATQLFHSQGGRGNDHSTQAVSMLQTMKIGSLSQ
ncbi:MAG: hypothetical protein COU66_00915 [Candidatus Pacebacteria bacterium CG10_big_fil_rev_8_21_14_0_10_44_11]|nr:MAG: hypothetical protein COU66_00915 [Candidatus Pacebacteria bacterium CG10_big_fil_rev_8_21_14_0_10_44_11]